VVNVWRTLEAFQTTRTGFLKKRHRRLQEGFTVLTLAAVHGGVELE
jgi:hypothetical protein